jgi:hypothetical protein
MSLAFHYRRQRGALALHADGDVAICLGGAVYGHDSFAVAVHLVCEACRCIMRAG